jgi:DNA-binding NarL/FixJ family response regulator
VERIRISLHADDPVVRTGMAVMLRRSVELDVHDARDAPDAPEPGVLVLCADSVDERALASMRQWGKGGSVRIVLVVGDIREAQLLDTIGCGVVALVRRREATADSMLHAIKAAKSGAGELPADLLGGLLAQVGRAQSLNGRPDIVAMPGLSDREADVVKLVAEGFDTREIATKLSYSERTVKNVLHGMMLRLDLRNRAHAVAYAARQGYV